MTTMEYVGTSTPEVQAFFAQYCDARTEEGRQFYVPKPNAVLGLAYPNGDGIVRRIEKVRWTGTSKSMRMHLVEEESLGTIKVLRLRRETVREAWKWLIQEDGGELDIYRSLYLPVVVCPGLQVAANTELVLQNRVERFWDEIFETADPHNAFSTESE